MQNTQIVLMLSVMAFSLNSFMAYAILKRQEQNWTHRLLFTLAIFADLYLLTNVSVMMFAGSMIMEIKFFLSRLVLFFSSFFGPILVLFVLGFPSAKPAVGKKYLFLLMLCFILTSLILLLPITNNNLQITSESGVNLQGFGLLFYLIDTAGMSVVAFFMLLSRLLGCNGKLKQDLKLLLKSLLVGFFLICLMTFFGALLLPEIGLTFFKPLFTVILVGSLTYAVIRQELLEIKYFAAQITTVMLGTILLSKIFLGDDIYNKIIDILIFLITCLFIFLLLGSLNKEKFQTQQLQILMQQIKLKNFKLKALDRARAEFISIASHQLRTPPATVKWYLSSIIAGEYGKLPEAVKETLKRTERTNNLLISLIDDVLNVSRLERGKLEFLFQPTNLAQLAEVTFEQFRPLALEKNQQLFFKQETLSQPKIFADKEKIRQVMTNLIDNAIKYTPSGGVIEISLTVKNNESIFAVKDNGQGLVAEDFAKLFEKYSRGKNNGKQPAGLGIGLFVAKAIILKHHGKIWAESKGQNLGSTFYFSLPLDKLSKGIRDKG